MKLTSFCYVLVLKRGEEQENMVPPKEMKVLEEFIHVALEELPNGLLPKRDIQHHLDLIPGENFPNQVAYQLNPTQHVDLNKQVIELMQKGLVRESMSQCTILSLLTPKKVGTWRMCTESRAINKITIKWQFLIPWIEDMMDELVGAKYLSKIDL